MDQRVTLWILVSIAMDLSDRDSMASFCGQASDSVDSVVIALESSDRDTVDAICERD